MLRSQEGLSLDRQEDLLLRLKNCVGEIQNKPKQSSNSTKKYSKQIVSRQMYDQNNDNSFKSSKKRIDFDLIDRSTNQRKQNSRNSQQRMAYKAKGDEQNILLRTKKYLNGEENNSKSYWTDRKNSLPLNQSTNFLNMKRNIFSRKNQEQNIFQCDKKISQSTKKRILERASLINQEVQSITPRKSFQSQSDHKKYEKNLLDRLNQKKNEYGYQRESQQIKNQKSYREKVLTTNDFLKSFQKERNQKIVNKQVPMKNKYDSSQKTGSQKFQNYSKFSMQTLVKQNDLRKAQKIEKLKKITEINQGINNRIRKLVDNFQSYLTHRVVS